MGIPAISSITRVIISQLAATCHIIDASFENQKVERSAVPEKPTSPLIWSVIVEIEPSIVTPAPVINKPPRNLSDCKLGEIVLCI
jgi:hypothetical protein